LAPEALKDYPEAPVTCREVTVKDGIKYAKFNGKVSKVDHQSVQVEISDVGDIPASTIESPPVAYACEFADSVIAYEIWFGIDDYVAAPAAPEEVPDEGDRLAHPRRVRRRRP